MKFAQKSHFFLKPHRLHRSLVTSAVFKIESKKISNDQELIQSDPTSCPQNQKGKFNLLFQPKKNHIFKYDDP